MFYPHLVGANPVPSRILPVSFLRPSLEIHICPVKAHRAVQLSHPLPVILSGLLSASLRWAAALVWLPVIPPERPLRPVVLFSGPRTRVHPAVCPVRIIPHASTATDRVPVPSYITRPASM